MFSHNPTELLLHSGPIFFSSMQCCDAAIEQSLYYTVLE